MSIDSEKMLRLMIDGKEVYVKESEAKPVKVTRLSFRGKDLFLTEEEGIPLRDALMRAYPLKTAIETIHVEFRDNEKWVLKGESYRRKGLAVSKAFVDGVFRAFKQNEELDSASLATRLDIPKTSIINNALNILEQCGKLTKRRDGVRTLFRIRTFDYTPKPHEPILDTATNGEVFSAIRDAQKKDMQAMRDK